MGLRRSNITATANADVTKLPTRLAGLTGHLAVILVRKSFTAATAASTAVSAAATTIAARATVARAAARTARAGRFGLGTSFVHLQTATTEIFAVESSNSLGRLSVVDHFHEAEAAGLTRFAIGGNMNAR